MPSQAMNLKASAFGNFMEWFSLQIIYMALGVSANVMSFHRARTGRALTSVDPRSGLVAMALYGPFASCCALSKCPDPTGLSPCSWPSPRRGLAPPSRRLHRRLGRQQEPWVRLGHQHLRLPTTTVVLIP